MKQKLFAIALGLVVGLFLVGCQEQTTKVQGTDMSTEQSANDDTATPISEKEKDVTKQGPEEAESPSAEEKAIPRTDTSTEQSTNDDKAAPISEKEKDVTKQGSEEAESPSAEEKAIHQEVNARLNSDENPSHADVPEEFLSADRDQDAFQAWQAENYDLIIEFQLRLLEEVGNKYGKSLAEVKSIVSRVASWRAGQGLAPDGY